MSAPYRVMAVCTGNICRSPIAEVVLRDRFERAGLGQAVVVDSAGTSDEEEGGRIDRRARAVLADAGYPVPDHRARQATSAVVGERDLVLVMTARHARWLRRCAPDAAAAARVRVYRSFDPAVGPAAPGEPVPESVPESVLDVEDPWYGDRADFEVTLARVEAAADAVVEHVRTELAAQVRGTVPSADQSRSHP